MNAKYTAILAARRAELAELDAMAPKLLLMSRGRAHVAHDALIEALDGLRQSLLTSIDRVHLVSWQDAEASTLRAILDAPSPSAVLGAFLLGKDI